LTTTDVRNTYARTYAHMHMGKQWTQNWLTRSENFVRIAQLRIARRRFFSSYFFTSKGFSRWSRFSSAEYWHLIMLRSITDTVSQ
jgi:hypothetical protein